MNNLKPTNLGQQEDTYSQMARVIQTGISELVAPFKDAGTADNLLRKSTVGDFFQTFLVHADQFTEKCCQQYAGIIRSNATLSDVRGTPTVSLAKQIRTEVFEPLDRILAGYVESLAQIGLDLRIVSTQLGSSNIINSALSGAAVGQFAGGFGNSGKTLGGINAVIQAGAEAQRKLVLQQRMAAMSDQERFMTYRRMAEFLDALLGLPERLLDYGCAKCFGSNVSLERQRTELEGIQMAIVQDLQPVVNLVMDLPKAAQRLERQIESDAKKEIEQKRKKDEFEARKRNPVKGTTAVAISIGLSLWGFHSCNLETAGENEMIGGVVLWVLAFGALIFGISNFFDRTEGKG